ncbi:hypothetical protein PS687_03477 [Pseudomonas fluorescens]|jgi:hypothetical protein|nr:hypothetical protein PS664_03832 [Pseudomonas fluorescens]VVN59694.1 hypothetical protein PS687_03477 [Pseudomonas fluorescens]
MTKPHCRVLASPVLRSSYPDGYHPIFTIRVRF